jgi:site-specific DNA-cytosine methylase
MKSTVRRLRGILAPIGMAAAASRDAAIERQVLLLIAREPTRLQTTDKNWLFAGNNEKHCKNCPGNK